jgi:putative aldouronate transport system substrate-binding protein
VDDKRLDRILSLFDYLYSDQGTELTRFGINGVDYTKNGDKHVLTGDKPKNDKYPSGAFFGWFASWDNSFGQINPNINEDARKVSNDAVDMYKRDGVVRVDPSFKVTYLNTPLKDKFVFPTIEEILAKVVLSKDSPETGWAKAIKDLNDKGLQQMIDEVNKKVAEMGIN